MRAARPYPRSTAVVVVVVVSSCRGGVEVGGGCIALHGARRSGARSVKDSVSCVSGAASRRAGGPPTPAFTHTNTHTASLGAAVCTCRCCCVPYHCPRQLMSSYACSGSLSGPAQCRDSAVQRAEVAADPHAGNFFQSGSGQPHLLGPPDG